MRGKAFDKILVVTLGVGFLFVCFIVLVLTLRDLYMEEKLDKEIEIVQNTLNKDKVDEKELNKILNRDKVSGSYSKIEKAYKDNIKSILKLMDNIDEYNKNVIIEDTFSIDNIKNDGPEFVSTKEKLKEYFNSYEKNNKELKKIKEDESLWSYLPEKKSSKFDQSYLRYNILKIFKMKYIKNITNEFSNKKALLDQADSMISFLEKNKDDWKIKEDEITFKTESLGTEYQKMNKKWEDLLSGKKSIIKIGE